MHNCRSELLGHYDQTESVSQGLRVLCASVHSSLHGLCWSMPATIGLQKPKTGNEKLYMVAALHSPRSFHSPMPG